MDLERSGTGWGSYGARLGGFIDLYRNRVLGMLFHLEFADSFGDTDVPFTDLAMMGGGEPMTAFVDGRLRGRSAIALSLDYRWPVAVWLDGWITGSVGNTYGKHLEDFDFSRLRASVGIGLRTADEDDHPFQLHLALGTDPFFQGGDVTTVRFVIGTTSGF